MTTAHRLTHRAKAFSLETYESSSRWRSNAAMAMDRVSDGTELLADLVDAASRAFRAGRMASQLSRKEARVASRDHSYSDAFMRGYFFAQRYQRPTLTPLHEHREEN
jgi:hypothetical protein